jgi:hypothetical protein
VGIENKNKITIVSNNGRKSKSREFDGDINLTREGWKYSYIKSIVSMCGASWCLCL